VGFLEVVDLLLEVCIAPTHQSELHGGVAHSVEDPREAHTPHGNCLRVIQLDQTRSEKRHKGVLEHFDMQ